MNTSERKLRNVLKVNGIFSMISGLTLLILSSKVGALMNIVNTLILIFIGIGLILFSGTVFYTALKKNVNASQVKSIVIQDWIWVIGSFIIIVLQIFNLSSIGYELLAAVAIIVASFAVLQSKYLRQSMNEG